MDSRTLSWHAIFARGEPEAWVRGMGVGAARGESEAGLGGGSSATMVWTGWSLDLHRLAPLEELVEEEWVEVVS